VEEVMTPAEPWPSLPLAEWRDTCATLHLWTQVIGKIRRRRAPQHPGAPNVSDRITREAYSHEVSSCGFWPGGAGMGQAMFYSYAYPQPAGFANAPIRPPASYARELGEFILPYDEVRQSAAPDETLLDFLQGTYEAAATLAQWDRASLERAA
jgi:hypothetical protein